MTQTAGRAARNVNGKVIMYADNMTESMQRTIDETARRRSIQLKYNEMNHIVPRPIVKDITSALPLSHDKTSSNSSSATHKDASAKRVYIEPEGVAFAADPIIRNMSKEELQKNIASLTALMKQAAKDLDFMQAAQYRDDIVQLQKELEKEERK